MRGVLSCLLALVLALGATPLAVYADEGEGTTQSETSTVSEVSEGTSETKQLKAGEIRVQTSDILLTLLTSLEKL